MNWRKEPAKAFVDTNLNWRRYALINDGKPRREYLLSNHIETLDKFAKEILESEPGKTLLIINGDEEVIKELK